MAPTKGPLPDNRKAPPERTLFAMKCLSEMRYGSALRAIMEQFKVGRSSAKRSLAMARLLMQEEEEELRPQVRAVVISRLERIIDRAEEAKDFSAAVRGVRELVGIYGLRAPEEIKLKIDPVTAKKLEDLSDDELRVLAKLRDQEQAKPTEH